MPQASDPRRRRVHPSSSVHLHPERIAAAVLFLAVVLVFARSGHLLGFYFDDGRFLVSLPQIHTLPDLWQSVRSYVPGRNLHILWQYLFFWPFSMPASHLPALHYLQSTMDAAAVILFYLVLRRLRISSAASLTASALFAFWPIHGETHYWMSALPMNIVSTAFVLTFILTTLSLLEGSTARWIYVLDVISCWCAMLTYDQTFAALLLLLGVRVGYVFFYRLPAWRLFTVIQLVDTASVALFIWLRLAISAAPGPMPFQKAHFWNELLDNARYSYHLNFGSIGAAHVRMLAQKATACDKYGAFAVAVTLFLFAAWLTKAKLSRGGPAHAFLFGWAALFWVAAYLPVWMWYPASRHHYLPTVGLFCAVAIFLHWLQSISSLRVLVRMAHLALAAIVVISIVASRSESHYWEEAYLSKRWLIEGLGSRLAGKSGLILESFPISHGPAMLITPHDAGFAPRLLMPDLPLPAAFYGALKARREGERIELDPASTVPEPAPKALAANQTVWLHFEALVNGVLRYSERDLSSISAAAR